MPLKLKLWLGKFTGWDKRGLRALLLFIVLPLTIVAATGAYSLFDDESKPLTQGQEDTIDRTVPDNLDQLIDKIIDDSLRDRPGESKTTPSPSP